MKNFLAPTLLTAIVCLTSCDQKGAEHESGSQSSSTPKPSPKPTPTADPSKKPVAAPAAIASRDIDVADAAKMLAANKTIVVLDIRTAGEFAKGHLAGAQNIDFMGADFATKLGALDKDQTYLMHCQSGGRSTKALPKFKALGFKSVLHLTAGFGGWAKAGQPVEK